LKLLLTISPTDFLPKLLHSIAHLARVMIHCKHSNLDKVVWLDVCVNNAAPVDEPDGLKHLGASGQGWRLPEINYTTSELNTFKILDL
jgi:hypothetical protein